MISMIAAFTELCFLSGHSDRSDHMQTKLKNDNFRADGKP